MKLIYVIIICCFCNAIYAQKLYKNKTSTLSAVSEKGYSYSQDKDNSSVYYYKKFDEYGESIVQLTFEATTLRKAVIIHLDPTQTLARLKEIYKNTTDEEADNATQWVITASNTKYYSGKARFECSNNYNTKDYLFVIILVD